MDHASEHLDLPDYLTTTELAALLRVSRATVQRLLEEHRANSQAGNL
ncbi:helix-turn-helix domain-containing protein [Actinomadura scrupuli]